MDTTILRWLRILWMVVIGMIVLLIASAWWAETNAPPGDRIGYWKLYLDAFKIIVTGLLVVLLGHLIPRGFSEARHKFERLKESRVIYSRAKTGVDYLSTRLCVLNLKEAGAHIQRIHGWKHLAELYPELAEHLDRRGEKMSPEQWAKLMYEQLHAVRDVLEKNASAWDTMAPEKRLAELHRAQEAARFRPDV